MRTEDEKSAVKREKSCGAVVIRTGGEGRRYLLTRSKKGVWGFPKGHMEAGETEHETALREIGFIQGELREKRPADLRSWQELRSLLFTAEQVTEAARNRKESLGAHYLAD